MSVLEWIIEGLALVLILYSIWLHRKAHKIMNNIEETAQAARVYLDTFAPTVEGWIQKIDSKLEGWMEAIDSNMAIPWGEHIFHALFNTLMTLGASEMGKGEQGKQTMALYGFQRIGEALGKGLKKEIPAVEYANQYLGGEQDGGMIDFGSMIGEYFGVKIPPGMLKPSNKPNPYEPGAKKPKEDSGIAGQ